MIIAHVNPKMLIWARKRAGLEISHIAKGTLKVERIEAWERGDEYPSQPQAIALAEKFGISYAMLFVPAELAPDELQIPDLRTLSGDAVRNPSLDFREVLRHTQMRQEWIKAERIDQDINRLTFGGKFDINSDPRIVSADMRRVFSITPAARAKCPNYEAFTSYLVEKAESAGVIVMRSAIVRHSTRRTLKVNEFRGFVLNDPYAPVIFVNDSDADAAQIFTIAHELAHIWIGADGISDRKPDGKNESKNRIEIFCDRVAAEFLVPEGEFAQAWRSGPTMENARKVATHFRVSTLVALRRAKDLGRITADDFFLNVNAEYERFKEIEKKNKENQKKAKKKGGNFWASFELRNSKVFNATVVGSLRSRRLSYTDASKLFGISLASTVRYLRRVGAD
jgi:Zn-dependent peptidase ImmA (M78 family)